jgi:hypothetical protein
MCGIIIRTNSQAVIKNSLVRNVKLYGISMSDSNHVLIRGTTIKNCDRSAIAVYDGSDAKILGCEISETPVGINIFTRGFAKVADTSVLNVCRHSIWIHHGGSGTFNNLLITAGDLTPSLSQDLTTPSDIAARAMKVDTGRYVSCRNSVIAGSGILDVTLNPSYAEIQSGLPENGARCKICRGDARNAMFSKCGHSIYCRQCWDRMEKKDEVCELCLIPVSGIVAPINCSRESDDGICSICFSEPSDVVILPCGHTTCWHCACRWFATSVECPFCRERNARPQRYLSYE